MDNPKKVQELHREYGYDAQAIAEAARQMAKDRIKPPCQDKLFLIKFKHATKELSSCMLFYLDYCHSPAVPLCKFHD